MGYCLLGHDTDGVTLVSPLLFDTRKAALAELSRVSAAGETSLPEEIFVVDLDAATPVLIVPAAPASVPQVEVADASVWEAPAPAVVDEPVEEFEPEESTAIAEEPPVPLGEALLSAAGALESSGIVAPESVGAESVAAEEAPSPEIEPVPEDVAAWPWDVASEDPPVEEPPSDEPPAEEPPVEEPPIEEPPAEEPPIEDPPVEYVPDPLEEPALDDASLLPAGVEESEPFESRPVIMGAYEEPAPAVAEPASIAPPATEDEPSDDVSGLLADLEEIPVGEPGVEQVAEQVAEQVDEQEAAATPEVQAEPKVYEAGDSDIDDLTCDDCVYLNTCPKRGESDPSDCGSFQWRAV